MVCGSTVKTETAYKILKGAFAYVVDNPNDQALRLKLKGFGVLQVNDGGHGLIRFRSLKEDEEDRTAALEVRINGHLGKTKRAPTERQEMDDLRNFIDAASYRLSAGGADGTISIKSGFLSNMSVRTPRSKLSLQSVTSLQRENWSQYRAKSKGLSLTKAAADGDDIFKADVKRMSPFGIAALPAASPAGSADKSSRAARSLHSQQTVPSHCDQPNLVFSHQHSKTPSHAKT